MPTCPAPLVTQKKCGPPSVTQLIEPNFPEHQQHHHHGGGGGSNASKQDTTWTKNSRSQTQSQQQQQQQQQQPQARNIYTWISAPRAIYNNKRLIRMSNDRKGDQQQQQQQQQQHGSYQNVMHDRRVIRGSNYTSTSNLQVGDGDGNQKEAEARRRQMLRKKYVSRNQRGVIGTPPPVRGRRHETVQTEKYLEELFLHPPELDAGCQTDLFLHRPPSPPYVPAKTGCDASTEILDGELFDFDIEVQPIIEVLVSRTLEQALVEVLHEEEIAEMKQQQQKILALREAELAELRRLEQEEQKRQAERDRRFLQDKIARDLDREMQERITAAKLLQGRLDEIVPEVMAAVDKIETEADRAEFERQITPWLAKEVAHEIGQWIDANDLLEDMIREILLHKKKLLEADAENTADEPEQEYDEVDPDEADDEPEPASAEPEGAGESGPDEPAAEPEVTPNSDSEKAM